jgi:hypothetical protein
VALDLVEAMRQALSDVNNPGANRSDMNATPIVRTEFPG